MDNQVKINRLILAVNSLDLKLNDFASSDFEEKSYQYALNTRKRIGSGAVGYTYLIEVDNKKYVLKANDPCSSDGEILKTYCDDVKNLFFNGFKLIQSIEKTRYILPNLINEALIGIFIGTLENEKKNEIESINFAKTTGVFIKNPNRPEVFTTMDLYEPFIQWTPTIRFNDKLNFEPKHYLYLLFQISHALLQAQEKYRFTHYDLHSGNLLWEEWPKDKSYLSYPIPNRVDDLNRIFINKDKCPFIIKIADYGLARMETKKTLLTSMTDNYPDSTFSEFNPDYDMISFLGTSLIDPIKRSAFSPLFSDIKLFKNVLKFVLWFFKDSSLSIPSQPTLVDLQTILNKVGLKYFKGIYRPKSSVGNYVDYGNTRSMVEVVNYLANLLRSEKLITKNPIKNLSRIIYVKRLTNKYKIFKNVEKFAPNIQDPAIPDFDQTDFNNLNYELDEGFLISSVNLKYNHHPTDFNFTLSQKQIDNCPIQHHFLTTAYIKKSVFNRGYKFESLCCKLDPVNYLRSVNKTGLVINGGFFNIGRGEDYYPIGPYGDKNIKLMEKYRIPEYYRDVYGFLGISDDGKLDIFKEFPRSIKNIFASGPILIYNNDIVFNPYQERFACNTVENIAKLNEEVKRALPPIQVLNETENDITVSGYYKYKSEKNGNFYNCYGELINVAKTFPKCDKIKAGDLSHSDNPNPRSALIMLNNGDYVILTVEGRGERGIGMDLYSLAEIIKKAYPNVTKAINLDGGRSSNFAWVGNKELNKIYISNPTHTYQYPVGNILTLTKKYI